MSPPLEPWLLLRLEAALPLCRKRRAGSDGLTAVVEHESDQVARRADGE